MCERWMRSTAVIGTASSMPVTPQRQPRLCGSTARHCFNGAAPNQGWLAQRARARLFSDLSTKSATFFRAPPRRKTSAPKGASHLPAAGEEICELELSMNDLHVQN